jgi:hypothetical protein
LIGESQSLSDNAGKQHLIKVLDDTYNLSLLFLSSLYLLDATVVVLRKMKVLTLMYVSSHFSIDVGLHFFHPTDKCSCRGNGDDEANNDGAYAVNPLARESTYVA